MVTSLRIGFVTPKYYPNVDGGGELSVKLLAEALVNKGHNVLVLSFDSSSFAPKIENLNGVRIIRYKSVSRAAQFLSITIPVWVAMKLWAKFVDIYHVYNVSPLCGAGLYTSVGGKPVIATLNSYAAICPIGSLICADSACSIQKRVSCLSNRRGYNSFFSIFYSSIFPLLTRMAQKLDGYIALSESVKSYHCQHGFKSKQIFVIPNFYERSNQAYPFKSYQERRSIDDNFNILYVGSVTEEKGLKVLIKAFNEISNKYTESRLIVVGTGRNIDEYRIMVKNLSLTSKVDFVGQLKDRKKLERLYLKSDIFVHPCIWPEPFGRTLLEAMSFNMPIIVSNAGAPSQIVGSAGLTFDSGNYFHLSSKIEVLLKNKDVRCHLSANSKQMLKQYEPNVVINKLVDLYQKLSIKNN